MRLTLDLAMLLIDRFEEFITGQVGEDVILSNRPDLFSIECLRKKKRALAEDKGNEK